MYGNRRTECKPPLSSNLYINYQTLYWHILQHFSIVKIDSKEHTNIQSRLIYNIIVGDNVFNPSESRIKICIAPDGAVDFSPKIIFNRNKANKTSTLDR